MPGFSGHLGVTEVTAGARALDPCEAWHPPTPTAALPESHRAFWTLVRDCHFIFLGFGDQIASVLPILLFRF